MGSDGVGHDDAVGEYDVLDGRERRLVGLLDVERGHAVLVLDLDVVPMRGVVDRELALGRGRLRPDHTETRLDAAFVAACRG